MVLSGLFVLNHFSKKRKFSGEISLMYCVWYGFGRGIIELLRTDSLMLGNIKVSCLLSFAICITSAVLLVVFSRRAAEKAEPDDYEAVFADNAEEPTEEIQEETHEQDN